MAIAARIVSEPAVEIRRGVFRPDWSAVTAPTAREALSGGMAARAGLLQKWSHALDESEDVIWRTVLRLYADRGRPPSIGELVTETGIQADRVTALLGNLQLRDLVSLESGSERILFAYPFTEAETGHRVKLKGQLLHALCAIDALGVGSMYRTDVTIESPCRFCGKPIGIATTSEGRTLRSVSPAEAVVWYDFAYEGSAAASCCPVIAFFCSDGHLRCWLGDQRLPRQGVRLAIDEALQVGRAVFGPVLAEPSSVPCQ